MADGTFTVGAGNMNAFESGVDISEALAEEADIRQVFFKAGLPTRLNMGSLLYR